MHMAGIIHRDIAPDNIMIQPDGSVKLLDFGAAKEITGDGKSTVAVIKHGYAPVEQYDPNLKRQGPWTDVYAVCATIYRAIEGEAPPDALTRLQDMFSDTDDVDFLKFDAPISENTMRIVMKGLSLKPEKRYADMGQMAQELYPQSVPLDLTKKMVEKPAPEPQPIQQPQPDPKPQPKPDPKPKPPNRKKKQEGEKKPRRKLFKVLIGSGAAVVIAFFVILLIYNANKWKEDSIYIVGAPGSEAICAAFAEAIYDYYDIYAYYEILDTWESYLSIVVDFVVLPETSNRQPDKTAINDFDLSIESTNFYRGQASITDERNYRISIQVSHEYYDKYNENFNTNVNYGFSEVFDEALDNERKLLSDDTENAFASAEADITTPAPEPTPEPIPEPVPEPAPEPDSDTFLDLSFEVLYDISHLADQTHLTELDLSYNYITDLSPLEKLTQLTELNLADNEFDDISPLSNLSQLTYLTLFDNSITDISPLRNLTRLTALYLSGNPIADISPLQNLTGLTYLALIDCSIEDITPLKSLTNLSYLDLSGNGLTEAQINELRTAISPSLFFY
jgi:serine/threonine protein kinase